MLFSLKACDQHGTKNCVVIFSKTTCPYCKMAKNVFNEIGATYKVIELDEHNDGRSLQEALAQMTGAKTVRRTSPSCAFFFFFLKWLTGNNKANNSFQIATSYFCIAIGKFFLHTVHLYYTLMLNDLHVIIGSLL
uniref:Glutaredoxin domain-containing protein n=1 Tax=Neolamprologus brichardi TaxID=32507 RepID=A0A3Q4HWV5_NEOBR